MSLKIQAALLPQKHISFSGSLVGLAGKVRSVLAKGPRTIEALAAELAEGEAQPNSAPSVEHIVLAATLLYAIRQVSFDDRGWLVVAS